MLKEKAEEVAWKTRRAGRSRRAGMLTGNSTICQSPAICKIKQIYFVLHPFYATFAVPM
ncbi:hypothetical protein HMPREF9141_2141 [Prevotella multiformis DSM 16608]|uniref:Uncharacterized protein n=1 Tax=Prevotella multiformis DSM 16608 TaxID=888743 RepID=F0F974_9BACT|nr:hypothetical protein HMPREF9141_2141 [Prevotella multiformis DSM 16608]